MSLTAIIILLLLGLILLVFELLIIPGTHISGIVGIMLILSSVFFGYRDLGTPQGHYLLLFTALAIVLTIVFVLRSNTWQKIALNTTISSKVENTETQYIKPGDMGKTITRLGPVGMVMVNNMTFEAKAGHRFIDPNTPVEVVKIEGNQLIVKQIDN